MFILKRDLNGKKSTSMRNVYSVMVDPKNQVMPDGIDEVKWVHINETVKLITFPHINMMILKTIEMPNRVWGGTLLQYKENDHWKSRILEEFYSL